MDIKQATKLLRNSAPEEFDNFARSFDAFSERFTRELLESDVSSVLASQGRAQMCLKIRQILEDAKTNKPAP